MSKEIYCTIGPASLNEWTLKRIKDFGVTLLRINLSHTKFDDLEKYIVKNHPYSMPAIVSIPWDDSHEPYRKWVDKND